MSWLPDYSCPCDVGDVQNHSSQLKRLFDGYRAALQRPIDLYDVRKFDSALGASLEKLASAHRSWEAAGSRSAPLLVDGSPIEDLCLSFVLPGAA